MSVCPTHRRRALGSERGVTLVELVTVVAVASMLSVTAVGYSIPWLARQNLTAATHDVHSLVQLTRIEAVSRNHPCRFVVDTASGQLQVWDTLGTGSINDDTLLHDRLLAESVGFARPDTGSAVTFQQIGGSSSYQVVFGADGMVLAGTGDLFLFGGDTFGSVSVFVAGGTEIRSWNGTSWEIDT